MTKLRKPELHILKSGWLESYEAPKPPTPKIEPMLPASDSITKPVQPQGVRGIQPMLPNVNL